MCLQENTSLLKVGYACREPRATDKIEKALRRNKQAAKKAGATGHLLTPTSAGGGSTGSAASTPTSGVRSLTPGGSILSPSPYELKIPPPSPSPEPDSGGHARTSSGAPLLGTPSSSSAAGTPTASAAAVSLDHTAVLSRASAAHGKKKAPKPMRFTPLATGTGAGTAATPDGVATVSPAAVEIRIEAPAAASSNGAGAALLAPPPALVAAAAPAASSS
jgi:hypothetical protein